MWRMKLDSKYFDSIRTRRKGARQKMPAKPVCQWDGCEKPGVHRAPVGRHAENQYFVFCFEHVKEYNKGYNYFSGLSDTEVARYQKEAVTGNRPTWSMGVNKDAKWAPKHEPGACRRFQVRDPFGFTGWRMNAAPRTPPSTAAQAAGNARPSIRWDSWPMPRRATSSRDTRNWSKSTTLTQMEAIAARRNDSAR